MRFSKAQTTGKNTAADMDAGAILAGCRELAFILRNAFLTEWPIVRFHSA